MVEIQFVKIIGTGATGKSMMIRALSKELRDTGVHDFDVYFSLTPRQLQSCITHHFAMSDNKYNIALDITSLKQYTDIMNTCHLIEDELKDIHSRVVIYLLCNQDIIQHSIWEPLTEEIKCSD